MKGIVSEYEDMMTHVHEAGFEALVSKGYRSRGGCKERRLSWVV